MYYCRLYSLHTSIQKLFEPLKMSEKLWRRSPNLSTTNFKKMVRKRREWHNTETDDTTTSFFESLKKKLIRKSYTTKSKSLEPSQMSEKLWQKQRNLHITLFCKMVEKQNKITWYNNETTYTTTTSFSPRKKNYFGNLIKQQRSFSNHPKFQSNYDKHDVVY